MIFCLKLNNDALSESVYNKLAAHYAKICQKRQLLAWEPLWEQDVTLAIFQQTMKHCQY